MNRVAEPRKTARLIVGALFLLSLLMLVVSLTNLAGTYTNTLVTIVLLGGIVTALAAGVMFVVSIRQKKSDYLLLALAVGGVLLMLSPSILFYIGFATGGAG